MCGALYRGQVGRQGCWGTIRITGGVWPPGQPSLEMPPACLGRETSEGSDYEGQIWLCPTLVRRGSVT